MTAPRRGYTLMETLVVIAIIAILIALLLPATRRVRGASEQTQCANNMRQLLLALCNYEVQHGKLPPGCVGPASDPAERLGWTVAIMSYIEQDALAKRFDLAAGFAGNTAPAGEPIRLFRCPTGLEPPGPLTHYVGCGGVGADSPSRPADAPGIGVFGFDRQLKLSEITDGTSNTIALFETHDRPGPWARGGFATVRGVEPTMTWDTPHRGLLMVGLADGSVRLVSERMPAALLPAATVAGGERVELE